jgi:UDP-N-acetylmuramoylalanine-D-glutamate ligase
MKNSAKKLSTLEKQALKSQTKQTELANQLETCVQQQNWRMAATFAKKLEKNSEKIRKTLASHPKLSHRLEAPELS